jgi:phosphatidylinositol alpha 1,6-mannosyltransferase
MGGGHAQEWMHIFVRNRVRVAFVKNENLRVAFFPDAYHEGDGVANTSRQFEAFAKKRALPFLIVHAGTRDEIVREGSVTRMQLRRSWLRFPLDRTHEFDPAFVRHYRELALLVRQFKPHVVQITGPSDIGILGALVAHRQAIPLAASWQTNLHQYARARVSAALSCLPKTTSGKLASAAERLSFNAMARFYKIPQLLFAPNQEVINLLESTTGKPCCLMSHSVDTGRFSPEFRDRQPGPFRIGYVGRLTAEKNVRALVGLEDALLTLGHRDFQIVIVGEGAEGRWLRKNMRQAEFTGVLTGKELSRTFANMDVLAFPSETETFGLVVLEALASGVPAIVTPGGGPKFTVQHEKTGFVASNFDEFVACTTLLMSQPELLAVMGEAARRYALSTSWESIFEGMYAAYDRFLYSAKAVRRNVPM